MTEPSMKRPGPLTWLPDRTWRFWAVVALLPVIYLASFGPACWIISRMYVREIATYGEWEDRGTASAFYRPVISAMRRFPFANDLACRYANFGAPDGVALVLFASKPVLCWIAASDTPAGAAYYPATGAP